jgi:hypothetical protein
MVDVSPGLYTKSSRNGNGHVGQANGAGTGNGTARSVPITINGRDVDLCALAQMTPSELAILAADLRKAGWPAWLVQLVTGANPGLTSTARHLTDQQRLLVDLRLKSLSYFHNLKKADREIDAFIERKGADRVMAALDRMTAPTLMAAE